MYLQQTAGNRPYLSINTSEPQLLYNWFGKFPVAAINDVYKLDYVKGDAWRDYFGNSIVELNYTNLGTINPLTGHPSGGNVPARNRDRSEQLFEQWMASSENNELFKTVKLSAIKRLSSIESAVTLIEDTFCLECEETEPANIYLFQSPTDGELRFHPNYAMVGAMLDKPLFGWPDQMGGPEMRSCHICEPGSAFITENMASLARRKFSMCKCAPCRGRL